MENKVILYIAMSLDGYIAKENGNIDWLSNIETYEEDNDYEEFYKDIDYVILGRKTYEQIINELSVDNYPYKDKKSYVISSKTKKIESDNIIFTKNKPEILIDKIKSTSNGNIWVVGGSKTIKGLVEEDLIDEYRICIMPFILGNGIPLFNSQNNSYKLKLNSSINRNNMVYLRYSRI